MPELKCKQRKRVIIKEINEKELNYFPPNGFSEGAAFGKMKIIKEEL